MNKKLKRFLSVILVTAFILINLYSASITKEAIVSATKEELVMMAKLRGLEIEELSDDEIRKSIYEYEGIDVEDNKNQEEKKNEYSMNILSADKMSILSSSNILLEGNVKVSFSFSSQDSLKILSSDKMIVDPNVKSVTAYSNVRFVDEDSTSGLSEINADVVTYSYEAGDLVVTGGTTESERKNNENEKIVFNTSAQLLNYRNKDNGLFFTDGYITTDKKKSLSTISAKEIAILDGGDMFLSNGYLKIGRVPILYLPFFFYPGSRLTINPAFGFNSIRGMFASSTIELFGKYPNFSKDIEESSFASLLKSGDSSNLVSNGLYYDNKKEELSEIEKWVEKNGNYLTILFDAYEKFGLHLGYDFLIKDDKYKIESKSGFIYSKAEYNSYNKELRYYSNSEILLNFTDLSLKAIIPFYSDPSVYSEYNRRLTSFSIDSFLGLEQKFPEQSSSITSYDMSFVSTISLPKKLTPFFIDSAKISNLEFKGKYNYLTKEKKYLIEDIYLPKLTANISGTIFSFKENEKLGEEKETKQIAFSDYFILKDPLLSAMYEDKSNKESNSNKQSSISLKYSINEELNNSYDKDENKNTLTNEILKNTLSGKITLSGNITNKFNFTEIITPEYTYSYKEENIEKRNDISFRSDTTLSIPIIGITYNLNSYLYKSQTIKTKDSYSEKQTYWAFDKENIKAHSISFSKSIELIKGALMPSLKYTLKPLTQSINVGLAYKINDFSLSLNWNFKEVDEKIKSDDIKLSLGYLTKYFTYSLSLTYQSSIYDKSDILKPLSLNSSISIRSEDKKYSLTEYIKYTYEKNGIYNTIDELTTTIVTPYIGLSYSGNLISGKYSHNSLDLTSDIKTDLMYSWYNRILTQFAINSKFHYEFDNLYATNLAISFSLNFKIQEFLAINLSVKTTNNSFYKYFENDNLNFSLLWQDLKNSFDFISNGRYNTGFTMDSLSIELVHYMTDWNLYCKYSATIVSSTAGYEWVPTVSIFLKWKTIPDLKIDENYKKSTLGEWETTSTVYGKK